MSDDQASARTYGGWRRSRSIGLLGLGPVATLVLLGSFAALVLLAAFSFQTLLYVAPPMVLGWAVSVIRAGGVPLGLLAVRQLRWWHGTRAGYPSYRAETVLRHTGTLQLPGILAATELLSADDGHGGRYGLVRDRHTGYLTATVRVAPVSTWLADPGDADRWVANWGGWLASLGYLPAVRWVTVTVDTAPDPGSALTSQVAAAIDLSAPRAAIDIMDQLVATAPAAAAAVDTRISITFDPKASPTRPPSVAAAVTETGQTLAALETTLGACGVTVLGRARAADLAGAVRVAFDPAVRGEITRLLATGITPALEERLNWASAGPVTADEHWDTYSHDSGISASWAWREAPRQNVTHTVLARLLSPGAYSKRVALQYRPLPAHAAARALNDQVRAAEFRHEYSRRTRRDVTARDLHDHARARQAADEEARGAGVSLLGLYVTTTVTDPSQLPQAVADTEAAAEGCQIRLQRLHGSQAAAFITTLPCGVCLAELTRRFRH